MIFHASGFRSGSLFDKQRSLEEFSNSLFLQDPVIESLKPGSIIEHGYGYFDRLIERGMQNIVDDMQWGHLPETAFALMQNLGTCSHEYDKCLHLILYEKSEILVNFDRTDWNVTPRTLQLLSLSYRRGQAMAECAEIRYQAIRAYLHGGLREMSHVLQPVPGVLEEVLEAIPTNVN